MDGELDTTSGDDDLEITKVVKKDFGVLVNVESKYCQSLFRHH